MGGGGREGLSNGGGGGMGINIMLKSPQLTMDFSNEHN